MEPGTKKRKAASVLSDEESENSKKSASSPLEVNYVSPDDCEKPGCRVQLYDLPGSTVQQKVATSEDSKDDNKKVKVKRKDKASILPQSHQSSKMTGAEVLFFFDLDYQPQKGPVDLQHSTVVEILEEIFNFLTGERHYATFKRNGKTMNEIYEFHLKHSHWLKWMSENDVINFKFFDKKEWTDKRTQIINVIDCEDVSGQFTDLERRDIKSVYDIISLAHNNYTANKCNNHDGMKDIFRLAGQLMPFQTQLRYNGNASFDLTLIVPQDLVSESCTKISNVSVIKVKPDSVYATRNKFTPVPHTGKIVAEVYGPEHGSSSSASEDEVKLYSKECERSECCNSDLSVPKPSREVDGILLKKYKKDAFCYLRQSLPRDCRDYETASKMTGQHVLQLICLAHEQKINARYCISTPIDDYVPVGVFLKNEYMFFSKLEINEEKLVEFSVLKNRIEGERDVGKGTVSFSNWRLDLTCSLHRIALLTAFLELLSI